MACGLSNADALHSCNVLEPELIRPNFTVIIAIPLPTSSSHRRPER
jgi:hypothetical protein